MTKSIKVKRRGRKSNQRNNQSISTDKTNIWWSLINPLFQIPLKSNLNFQNCFTWTIRIKLWRPLWWLNI